MRGQTRVHSLRSWILGALVLAPAVTLGQDTLEEFPDGVCYPVNGSGYIVPKSSVTRADKIPVGPFSPLVEGDSLVVVEGTITFIDFRNRQHSVFGPGTTYTIPRVVPDRPTPWEEMKKRLRDIFRDPVHSGQDAGATRGTDPAVWPDKGVEFAPEVPIVLAWSSMATAPSKVRIQAGDSRDDFPVPAADSVSGELAWDPAPKRYGPVEWTLLDSDGEPLAVGRFTVLTPREAEDKRQVYRARAGDDGTTPKELGAVLRALADRSYLW